MFRLAAFLLAGTLCILAQTNTGSITGTVFDQQRAAIAGVKVTATNVGTNVSQSATSTSSGGYTIPALTPGTYLVTGVVAGFDKASAQLTVASSTTATLDITLTIGATKAEVTVTTEVSRVQEANAAVQYAINPQQIAELPILNSSVLRALEMIPGVVGEAGTEQTAATMGYTMPGATLSVGGGRMGTTQYKADGVDNSSMYFGRIAQSFSADSIQEVQVQQNSFSAEYGRVGGGVVSMTTKSGSNEFHGTVFSFIQNDALNASPYTNTYRFKGKQRLWRGGGVIGGPVYIPKVYKGRDKSFFFASYEPLRQSTSTTWYENTPTAIEREGDFSQTVYNRRDNVPVNIFRQFEYNAAGTGLSNTRLIMPAGTPYPAWPGNKIPKSLISPIGKKLIDLFPTPNYVNPDPSQTSNYGAPMSVDNTDNRYSVKWDQVITSSNRMSFRISTTPTTGKRFYYGGKDSLLDMNASDRSTGTGLAFNETFTWGGNKVNELRMGFNRSYNARVAPDIQNSKNWFAEFGLPSRLRMGMPRFNFTNAASVVAGTGNYQIDNVFQLNEIFNYLRGRHSIKAGFEFMAPQQNITNWNNVQGSWSFDGNMTGIGTANTAEYLGIPNAPTGRGAASLLLGFPSSINIAPAVIPYQYRWKYYAGFLQDDYKITPRLTVNLGLRYQVEVPRSEKNHNQGNFVNDYAIDSRGQRVLGYIQLSGLGKGANTLYPTRYNNIEPRFGFAYRIEGIKWLKVARGGYGISHVPTNGLFNSPYPDLNPRSDQLALQGGKDGGQVQLDWNPLVLPDNWTAWPKDGVFADISRISTPAYLNQNVTIPYLQQWNLGLGFEFGKDYAFEATYVGSKGTQLFGPARRLNTIDQAKYAEQYTAGLNMSDQFDNPYGLVNSAGNIIKVSRSALLRPNPMLGAIADPLAQGHNSSYNSMQSQLTRRFSQGVQFNLNYTFSKNLDSSSCEGQFCTTNLGDWANVNPQLYGGSRGLERSVSTFDIKHNIRFSFNAELPFGRGKLIGRNANRFVNLFIGNWKAAGLGSIQSGRPWATGNGSSAGFPDDVGTIRANWKPGVTGCIANPNWRNQLNDQNRRWASYYMVDQMFMPASRFTVGNTSRTLDMCRMPWSQTFNASLLKEIVFHEQIKLQIRAEVFGVLNHVNFIGNVNSTNMFTGLDYQNYVNPPVDVVRNISTNYTSMTQNIGPTRTMQVGLKLFF